MADLSKQQSRRNAQDRITNNRDAVNLTRREDRTPSVNVAADMRNAQRADQSRKVDEFLASFDKTIDSYMTANVAERRERAEVDYAQGTTDAVAGIEAQKDNVAYERAYHSVMAGQRQTAWETETSQEIERMVNEGSTIEDIETYTTTRAAEFISEASDLFEHPDVRMKVGSRLSNYSNRLQAETSAKIKEKTDNELVTGIAAETVNQISRGEPVDFYALKQEATEAGLNADAVMDAVLVSVSNYATETGDASALLDLLNARSPEDVARAMNQIEGAPLPPVDNGVTPPERELIDAPVAAGTEEKFIDPLDNMTVSSGIGRRTAPKAGASTDHGGLDIPAPVGTPVKAPASGEVIQVWSNNSGGNQVRIRHSNGTVTGYAHLQSSDVKVGDRVTQGQVFAKTGNTGNSTGPHLHITTRDADGNRVDFRTLSGKSAGETPAKADAVSTVALPDAVAPDRRERPAGRPLLNPAQQARALAAYDNALAREERLEAKAKQEDKEAIMMTLWEQTLDDKDVSQQIEQAVREDRLTVQEGMALNNSFRSYRQSEAEGVVNDDTVLKFQRRFAQANPDYNSIVTDLDAAYSRGEFGDGRAGTRTYYELRTRASNGWLGGRDFTPVQQQAIGSSRAYLTATLSGGAELTDPASIQLQGNALNDYSARVQRGENPQAAADAVIAEYKPRMSNVQPLTPANGGANGRSVGGTTGTNNTSNITKVDINGDPIR
ncbi:peptidoglycan DD-metalloendopeptidase family protein [Brevundimonas sp. BH3]|uniref:M23 family metallopeptidase n=1 Tax=Brevundimonas sp. BH3 TaxID=3133089 RepID=UPI00324C3473